LFKIITKKWGIEIEYKNIYDIYIFNGSHRFIIFYMYPPEGNDPIIFSSSIEGLNILSLFYINDFDRPRLNVFNKNKKKLRKKILFLIKKIEKMKVFQ